MNTTNFLKVLQHFRGSSREEAKEVLSLKDDFPFSQVLHVLSARVSKDHQLSNHQQELQLAAVYSADRGVLKEIMTAQFSPPAVSQNHSQQAPAPRIVESTSSDLALELQHDMERLDQLRKNFEMMFVDTSTTSIQTIAPRNDSQENPVAKDTTKSKKQRIIELARSVKAVEAPETTAPPKTRRRKKDDDIINEIATKEEITPESEKQKEQLEIINQFIRSQPSISNAKDRDSGLSDLSTVNTADFGDNIVSETLVEILIKQGKKDKAIEVLKKLIWKFPQKKAYFAAQIEDLKK